MFRNISIQNFGRDLADYVANPGPEKLKGLRELAAQILASTKSDIATIAELKKKRVNWSNVIRKIANETGNIRDAHYGDSAAYESYGGIVYTGYEFDTVSNKIVLSGISKTLDGTNFTLLSNLIQQMESSPDFENVEMRSFTKSKSGSGTSGDAYFANFKIDLAMQKKTASEKDRPSLTEAPEEKTAGAKRTDAIPVLTPLLEKFSELKSQVKLPFGNSASDSFKKEEKNMGTDTTQAQTQAQIQSTEQSQVKPVNDEKISEPVKNAVLKPSQNISPTTVTAPLSSTPATGISTKPTSASAHAASSASAPVVSGKSTSTSAPSISAPAVNTKSTSTPAPKP